MARRRTKRTLRARVPSRVKTRVKKRTRRRTKRSRGQHAELAGLGLLAAGIFLATLLYLGWQGGYVGARITDALDALLGGAAYGLPAASIVVGALMLARSELVELNPFRTGVALGLFGIFLVLGDHGGYVGSGLATVFGGLLGGTGQVLLGLTALLGGVLLVSGASAGAELRRSGRVVRRAGSAARRSLEAAPVVTSPSPSEAKSI